MTHVVRCSNRNAILVGMPAHVQNLLVEVHLVGISLSPHARPDTSWTAPPRAILLAVLVHRRRHAHLLGLERRLVCLEYDLGLLVGICRVDHKVVVVAARHDVLAIAGEDHLELVEDAVILVGVAQSRSQVLVDWNDLDGLSLHVDIPDLYRQVIAGNDVTAIVGEADVGDGGDDFGKERAGGRVLLLLKDCNAPLATS